MAKEDNHVAEKVGAGVGAAAVTTGLATIGGSLLGGIAMVAAAPVATAVGLGAAGYGIAKSAKNKKKLEEENRRLKEDLSKKNSYSFLKRRVKMARRFYKQKERNCG